MGFVSTCGSIALCYLVNLVEYKLSPLVKRLELPGSCQVSGYGKVRGSTGIQPGKDREFRSLERGPAAGSKETLNVTERGGRAGELSREGASGCSEEWTRGVVPIVRSRRLAVRTTGIAALVGATEKKSEVVKVCP